MFPNPVATAWGVWSRAAADGGFPGVRKSDTPNRRVVENLFEPGVVFCTSGQTVLVSTVRGSSTQCRRPAVP